MQGAGDGGAMVDTTQTAAGEQRRTAVLDRAGELNRRLKGLHHPCGLLRRLRVLKRGSTSVGHTRSGHGGGQYKPVARG